MKDLKFKPSEMSEGSRIERFIESYVSKDIEDRTFGQSISISFQAVLLGKEMLVTGKISGNIILECYTCLERFSFPIEIKMAQSYPSIAEEIDLSDEIRQLLILNLSDKPVCRENCAGLCPQCGKNLNREKCNCSENPYPGRWEKLKDLIKDK